MLSVSLEASFSSNGTFSLDTALTGLGQDLLNTDFGEVRFDPADVLGAVARLGPPDLEAVLSASAGLAEAIDLESALDLDLDSLLAPLNQALAALEMLDSGIDLQIDASGVGLPALQAGLTSGVELFNGPLKPVIDLLGAGIPSLQLDATIGEVTGGVGGLLALVTLLGGLMAIDAVVDKVHQGSIRVGGMLNVNLAAADAERLSAIAAGDLADRIASADHDDGVEVNGLLTEIADFVLVMRSMQESWALGMGRGEAALIGLDLADCAVQLETARAALDEALLPLVGELASSIRGMVDPLLSVELPDPMASVDDAFDAMVLLLDPLRGAVDQLDRLGLAETIGGATSAALSPISAVADTLDTVLVDVGGALQQVVAVVEDIDLQPLIDGISSALAPVTTILNEIDAAIAVGLDAINAVAAAITTGLDGATTAIGSVSGDVTAAFTQLSDRLGEVDFEAVQAAISSGLGQVASTLASAQLSPYFDAANDIIDTTTDVIDAVPFGLLPTDVQQEIVDLSRPVKQVDFDQIAQDLRTELQGIMGALNGDVLDEVDAAYQAVVAFLISIDPGAAIAEFEAGPFAELRAIVDDIDPDALLAPVEEALAPVRSTLGDLNLTTAVLDPVAEIFAVVNEQLAQLDPAQLLAPVVAEVDQVRTDVADTLQLSSWSSQLTEGRDKIVGFLNQLDPTVLADAAANGAMTRLRQQPNTGPGLTGTIVNALSQSTGLPTEAASWTTVRQWLGSVDGAAEVGLRLEASADILSALTVDVEALDPGPAINAATGFHRRLLQALSGLPPSARLRGEGEMMLVNNTPTTTIAPLIDNHQRYLTRLRADDRVVAGLSVSGFSQITATTDGLTDTLAPLTSISDWIRSLAGRFGVQDLDRPWTELLDDLIVRFGPDQLLPAMSEIITAFRDKIITIIDSAVLPVTDAIAEVEGIVDLIDLEPIVDELTELHQGVVGFVNSLDPAVVLGPVLAEADAVIARVASFNPLDPVRVVIDDLQASLTTMFDAVTPSVVFEPIISSYDEILRLAAGLDVKGLLQPILDALAEIEIQLEVGIEETAVALGKLQDALPDRVEDAAASVSGSVSVGLSL